MKLLIADRDENERLGIRWLVTSSSLPFSTVLLASTVEETIAMLESERPDVVILELDMVPRNTFEDLKWRLGDYVQKVIVTTTEATFARAMEGIQLHVEQLLVKPLSPAQLQGLLKKSLIKLEPERSIKDPVQEKDDYFFYHELFVEEASIHKETYTLFLVQPDQTNSLRSLHHSLQAYPFQQPVTILPLSQRMACLYPSLDRSQVVNEARRFLRDWHETSQASIGIAFPAADLQDRGIYHQYQDVKKGIELFFYTGFQHVSEPREQVSWRSIDPFLSPEEQAEWEDMLMLGDQQRMRDWMYQSFLNMTAPYPDPGLLKTRLTSILAHVRRYMKTHHLHLDPSIEEQYQGVFQSILHDRLLYKIVQDMLLFISYVVEEVDGERLDYYDVVESCLTYIKSNFGNPDLSLEEVAASVNRNPSYISSLIKDRKKQSYRKLLLDIRINEAKRLLGASREPIQQIAEQVGFSQSNHFSRKFKEATGVSPKVFRNQKFRS
ncbi:MULTISPECIES: helix-turn-helix domain-containing protein [Pontibacillus]|uniref:Helix-turn-helix domain-containing protein n=1 Tax=Pontibacillus chungwhensis TaxID=265426 RepID=A0ABY8V709_9BACI|nr:MULTISPECIES: helix-turn-helix domain-containing protein [Pontibacillus]MCD5322352.1 helix-turn-helix domain-containing protein [Pontibacillus sp. HN14]WIF99641.1 helix-turn-helix domain-containing protein [Pontibacillus chungwhensis]